MKVFCFLFLFSFFLGVFGQDSINANGHNIFYHDNGEKASEGEMKNGLPVGIWKNYFKNGLIKSEGEIKNNKQNGNWLFYLENGELIKTVYYYNNLKNGSLVRFSGKDTILYTEEYRNDTIVGKKVTYFSNGCVKSIESFKDGLKTGISKEFSEEDSRIVLEESYLNGDRTNQIILNRYTKDSLKTGIWREFHENGNIKNECFYINGVKDGIEKLYDNRGSLEEINKYKKGQEEIDLEDSNILEYVKNYYSNGKLKSRGTKRLGLKQGVFRYFNELGDTVKCELYYEDTLICSGNILPSGDYKDTIVFYFKNGNVSHKGVYSNGVKNGMFYYYYQNGKLNEKGRYKDGLSKGMWTGYYQDRSVKYEIYYVKGKLDGEYIEYDSLGKEIINGNYSFGDRDGKWMEKIGDHYEIGKYNEGNRTGDWIYYFENGNIAFKGEFKNGKPFGKHKYYWEDSGNIRKIEKYKNGRKHGKWRFFDENRNEERHIIYKKGKLIVIV
jgi:uncharacterized protein